jgi:hypothetical protein
MTCIGASGRERLDAQGEQDKAAQSELGAENKKGGKKLPRPENPHFSLRNRIPNVI